MLRCNVLLKLVHSAVRFVVKLTKDKMMIAEKVGFIEKFKLESLINATNMHLFDHEGRLRRYNSALDIIDDYFNSMCKFLLSVVDVVC
jgi:DNA topoisomerase-2